VASDFTSTKTSMWSGIKLNLKKAFFCSLVLIFLFSGVFIYGKYFHTIGEGYRTGLLQKFPHNGNLIKTYKGEMILNNVSDAGKQIVPVASGKFYFTITSDKLANQLDTIQGQLVTVHYQQKMVYYFGVANRYI